MADDLLIALFISRISPCKIHPVSFAFRLHLARVNDANNKWEVRKNIVKLVDWLKWPKDSTSMYFL